ncbi:Uma2 family endonuclease [Iningainema tapete]|uniref:Uma2 family endonuclease n=1 Tax=Iningainema tapete BLCC-T55 TaxID=2748662 RepID=A0A8J6XIY8_9CYAN|nr:Uma2 family endonuclease [Iningainema tapete]MBD2777725.1 Uma2 family endonuclease [Iningainema tapete BLCC-T55]
MLKYNPLHCLPSSEELPDSDDTPVDNELLDLIPGLLKAILALLWANRWDWFFGVDMGIYYDPDKPAIVPDGFLSIGVERLIDEELRLSYVLWEENVVPIFVLEVVSKKYRGEYTKKKRKYAEMGVLFYAVYSSRRRRKPRLEVYRLVNGSYELLPGNPVWLPEIGLAIGFERGTYQGILREWLYWYDEQGQRLLTPEERITQAEELATVERQRRQQEQQRRIEAERQRIEAEQQRIEAQRREQLLAERLKALGVDPETLL